MVEDWRRRLRERGKEVEELGFVFLRSRFLEFQICRFSRENIELQDWKRERPKEDLSLVCNDKVMVRVEQSRPNSEIGERKTYD